MKTSSQKAMEFNKNVTKAVMPPRWVGKSDTGADKEFISSLKKELGKRLGWSVDNTETSAQNAPEVDAKTQSSDISKPEPKPATAQTRASGEGLSGARAEYSMDDFIAELDATGVKGL